MLLSYNELSALVRDGVIEGAVEAAINAASIDIHLGNRIMVEECIPEGTVVDYTSRGRPRMVELLLDEDGYVLEPGEFILAQSREVFHLPRHISAEYKLKSSMARIGLEHMNAGWCDAGWHGSVLTLEFKNMLRYHSIRICPGDAIGQMVFFAHTQVPERASYAARGRYNNDRTVTTIRE